MRRTRGRDPKALNAHFCHVKFPRVHDWRSPSHEPLRKGHPRDTVSAPRAVRMKRSKVEWGLYAVSVCMFVLGFRAGGVHCLQTLIVCPFTRSQFGPR